MAKNDMNKDKGKGKDKSQGKANASTPFRIEYSAKCTPGVFGWILNRAVSPQRESSRAAEARGPVRDRPGKTPGRFGDKPGSDAGNLPAGEGPVKYPPGRIPGKFTPRATVDAAEHKAADDGCEQEWKDDDDSDHADDEDDEAVELGVIRQVCWRDLGGGIGQWWVRCYVRGRWCWEKRYEPPVIRGTGARRNCSD
ncbi:hypothetical protein EJ06DRAFT_531914 [Trichodelitschia bisporula]|uniref:Uncharacterized protein n=1 Tax=Trichodelitschia bisporula TaxID=703511 RepID=A0A6G1HSL8_9PEZI|nr:hypothetical protein EJ06DRAFT_531914 [Trichodelitschia bisporula]